MMKMMKKMPRSFRRGGTGHRGTMTTEGVGSGTQTGHVSKSADGKVGMIGTDFDSCRSYDRS
jgi:hypothetical protein